MDEINFNKCIKKLGKIFILIVTAIIFYSILLSLLNMPKYLDPMLKSFTNSYMKKYLSGWSISHFILFLFIGYYYSNCFIVAMLYGILWEIFEYVVGEFFPMLFPTLAYQIDPTWTDWYYGRFEDIIMNFLGFIVGKMIRIMFNIIF